MLRKALQSALCMVFSPLMVAQQTVALTQSMAGGLVSTPSETQQVIALKKGTRIKFVTLEEISSAKAVKGQLVTLRVANEVWQNGSLLVPAGAPATGRVSRVRRAAMGRKNGFLDIEPVSVKLTDGTRVKLHKYAPGEDACGDFGPCWAMVLVLAPLLILASPMLIARAASDHSVSAHANMKGEESILKKSSPCWGFTASQVRIHLAVLQAPDVHPAQDTSGSN